MNFEPRLELLLADGLQTEM